MKTLIKTLAGLCLLLIALTSTAAERVAYYHNDALGSPVAATDQNGNLLWRETYAPYGERLKEQDGGENNRWFTGKQEEAAFGINYFGARWYDPSIGRFLAIDPVGFSTDNIQSFNRYAYANNNPYKYVDPDGRNPKLLADLALNIAFNLATTGKVNIVSAVKETVSGALNPFKTIQKAKKLAGIFAKKSPPSVQQVNPKNLIPTQTRNEVSGSKIKRLSKDMKKNGFDQTKPVDATRNSRGRLEIQDGHHRTEAAKKAGLGKIPVRVSGE